MKKTPCIKCSPHPFIEVQPPTYMCEPKHQIHSHDCLENENSGKKLYLTDVTKVCSGFGEATEKLEVLGISGHLRAYLTSPFAPLGRSGHVTHATMR